jgi:prepilin-type N-terminal cleavage/methylation domain-containing protein
MRRSSAGFTLIELLVAIMILTLFMTAAMGAVRIASKSTTAGVVRADTTSVKVRTSAWRSPRTRKTCVSSRPPRSTRAAPGS